LKSFLKLNGHLVHIHTGLVLFSGFRYVST
jgi:hypothetical protein